MAVGDRIQQWAYANHPDEMDAALGELVGDPSGPVFGEPDIQPMASWQLNDRELPGGGTPEDAGQQVVDVAHAGGQ
jgi:hypothetical protein